MGGNGVADVESGNAVLGKLVGGGAADAELEG